MDIKNIPFIAVSLAFLLSFSPSFLDINELTPMLVPKEMAISIACIGYDSDIAVNAFNPILATNMLSTKLYKASESIDITIGVAILIDSFLKFIVSIILCSFFMSFTDEIIS